MDKTNRKDHEHTFVDGVCEGCGALSDGTGNELKPADIYVATSWRNTRQPAVVKGLREEGFSVYDFRHPEPGNDGFHWSNIDVAWESWTMNGFRNVLGGGTCASGTPRGNRHPLGLISVRSVDIGVGHSSCMSASTFGRSNGAKGRISPSVAIERALSATPVSTSDQNRTGTGHTGRRSTPFVLVPFFWFSIPNSGRSW